MRLLIAEDNDSLAILVRDGLNDRGFVVDHVTSLQAADDAIGAVTYDAMILDLGLPDGDGLAWLCSHGRSERRPPTLILTARDTLAHRVDGLNAGADDFLAKPFAIEELAARLRALLRRPGSRTGAVIQIGELALDTVARTARYGDRRLPLSRREMDLLELLMRRAGAVVHKGSIENALYSFDDETTPNAVEAVVSRLRRRLEQVGAPAMLMTMRGMGYLLKDVDR